MILFHSVIHFSVDLSHTSIRVRTERERTVEQAKKRVVGDERRRTVWDGSNLRHRSACKDHIPLFPQEETPSDCPWT